MSSRFSLGFTAKFNVVESTRKYYFRVERPRDTRNIIKFYLQNDILEMSINVSFRMGKRSHRHLLQLHTNGIVAHGTYKYVITHGIRMFTPDIFTKIIGQTF